MRGVSTSLEKIRNIQALRRKGYSINEISKEVSKSKSIVSKYIQGVSVLPAFRSILIEKQGGSKFRSERDWKISKTEAVNIMGSFSKRDKIIILSALYWGEGTKTELNIINSDPYLLRVFLACIQQIGVPHVDVKATLRIYEDISAKDAIVYWSKILKLPQKQFTGVNVIYGKKKGKLKYGMCRIRVRKSAKYFKLIMSIISHMKSSLLPS